MSVSLVNTPYEFQPVLSDGIYFTVSSSTYNAASTFKFKYIYELYVGEDLVFQGKCAPNEYSLGIIDLQQILESYTNSLPISYWDTTPIYTHTTFPFSRPANDEVLYYYAKVGYEYADSPTALVTGFTGIGDVVGSPAFLTDGYKVFRSTMGTNGRATQASFNIDPFVLSGTPTGLYPTTSGLFLTNAPRIQNIDPTEYYTLGFTNYYLYSGATTGLSEGYYVKYTFYNDEGQVITATTYDNIVSNGGGPRTDCNNVYQQLYLIEPLSSTTEYNTLYVGAGPANIPNFPANCAEYTVQLFGGFTGSTSPIPVSPTPTPSATPGALTPTPTPTPSTTPVCGTCTAYSLEYTGVGATIVTIVNCTNGVSQNLQLFPNISYGVCSCSEPFTTGEVIVLSLGPCVPPVTPTPSPSFVPPTPTPSCAYRAWNIFECVGGTCAGGTCSCENSTLRTVYTLCGVTDITDPSTEIYENTALTNPFTGDFVVSGTIYNSTGSGVTVVCNVGGPC